MEFDIPQANMVWTSRMPSRRKRVFIAALVVVVLFLLTALWSISAPTNFPTNSIITIPTDSSAGEFAATLKNENVIRSVTLFKILARVSRFDHHLDPGSYVFTDKTNAIRVLWRIGNAKHGIDAVRITLTEGMTTKDMDQTFKDELPGFDSASFLQEASTSEGYLFPDTYLFMPGTDSHDLVVRLKSRFSDQIASITPQVLASKHSFNDIVILASILEREANTPDDMRMVAGILWNRIDAGMPLQVDATFGYIHGENGYTPTASDLNSESPYNTYRHTGLPPTAISNPGLEALLAAATPTKTDNLYYLTGKDGEMHYAKTFEQHKKNRALYLD